MGRATSHHGIDAVLMGMCLVAAGISGDLLATNSVNWRLSGAGESFTSRCGQDGDAPTSCSSAAGSDWGRIVVPGSWVGRGDTAVDQLVIPIGFLGLAYFVFLGTWLAMVGTAAGHAGRWRVIPQVVQIVGAGFSLVYLGVMFSGIAPLCRWCVAVHLLNLLLVASIFLACRRARCVERGVDGVVSWGFPSHPGRTLLGPRHAVCTLGVACVMVAVLWFYYQAKVAINVQWRVLTPYRQYVDALGENREFLAWEHWGQSPHDVLADESDDVEPASLIVFVDYQCPMCRCLQRDLRENILPFWEGRIEVGIRHYPLSGECNHGVNGSGHVDACSAAYAAEAARLQGGDEAFWNMHQLLLANQGGLGAKMYRRLAERIGLDPDQLIHDMQQPAVEEAVTSHVELGRQLGVERLPAMFLNGRRVSEVAARSHVFWQMLAARSGDDIGSVTVALNEPN